MKYQWILFDADDTLFHFDAFEGLRLMFSRYGMEFSPQDFADYQAINKPLWVDYQNGSITAAQLQNIRFATWTDKLAASTQQINSAFLTAMADICTPLPGAKELVSALQGKAKLGIITNGFTELQTVRLERTGLKSMFSALVISEEVGIAKPDAGIFEHAFQLMNYPPKEQILMVGDNPHSDILGGINAGIDTCWVNSKGDAAPAEITPRYQVSSLAELQQLLLPSAAA